MSLHFRLRRFLRASVLMLLVLGLLAKPVVMFICETHSIEHALLAANEPHGMPHFQGDHDDPGDQGQSGAKHTHGAHGFWHQAGLSFAPVVPGLTVALIQLPSVELPPLPASAVDDRAPPSPFRPPIA